MNNYIFNIGLNNNPYTAEQIQLHLTTLVGATDFFTEDGEWNGEVEPTIVFRVSMNPGYVDLFASNLCARYTQTCIAVWNEDQGYGFFGYQPDHRGQRYSFDEKQFIWPSYSAK
jgi:hypothetical protein